MKTTKEKIGLAMLAITIIGAVLYLFVEAFMADFWLGVIIVGVFLYFGIMIKYLFDE